MPQLRARPETVLRVPVPLKALGQRRLRPQASASLPRSQTLVSPATLGHGVAQPHGGSAEGRSGREVLAREAGSLFLQQRKAKKKIGFPALLEEIKFGELVPYLLAPPPPWAAAFWEGGRRDPANTWGGPVGLPGRFSLTRKAAPPHLHEPLLI